MRITVLAIAGISMVSWAGGVEFGLFTGAMVPAASYIRQTYTTSPVIGADILHHMEHASLEASVSAVLLQHDVEFENYSASMIPIRAGFRTYTGPVFVGAGLGDYLITEKFDDPEFGSFDETSFLLSAYFKIGSLVHFGETKVELAIEHHLVDFMFDKSWVGITATLRL
jgi:hypothetical protein